MKKQLNEKELIELQIQAYEFYAGLIDRAVGTSTHEAHMPRWDEQRALEYHQLAEQLRQRLAELEAQEPDVADGPGIVPVPTAAPAVNEPAPATIADGSLTSKA